MKLTKAKNREKDKRDNGRHNEQFPDKRTSFSPVHTKQEIERRLQTTKL